MATRAKPTRAKALHSTRKIRANESGLLFASQASAGRDTFKVDSTPSAITTIEQGVSWRAVETLQMSLGITMEQLAVALDIPSRTMTKRRADGRLKSTESDRLVRLGRLWSLALQLHEGDIASARRWFQAPRDVLDGNSPLQYSRTEPGSRAVEELIGRLEHGVFS